MGGGNLSFQVHPLTEYIQHHFGMHYTQDESYYMLDAGPDASVYLGLKDGIDPAAMVRDLEAAQAGGPPFPADKYIKSMAREKTRSFPHSCWNGALLRRKFDGAGDQRHALHFHFQNVGLGQAGAGWQTPPDPSRSMALANIQWDRTTRMDAANLINRFEPLAEGDGWREERTGLHELEFIETRRHWFTKPVPHDTMGGVNVLNLVEGEEAIVESPDRAFAPFVVHYAETFIVPAAVGPYTIRPHGTSVGRECATIKAFVRT